MKTRGKWRMSPSLGEDRVPHKNVPPKFIGGTRLNSVMRTQLFS